MKLIFSGTPEFAATALQALIDAGHTIELVLTQPDRRAGRGMTLQASPVKRLAETHGIEVFQPTSLRDTAAQARLQQVGAEAMVVAAYGLILPQAVLDMPKYGCINIHASLLPRWRGAAPIQRAILAGDRETGVSIMQMEAGLDTGPVMKTGSVCIESSDNAASLHDKLANLGATLIVETMGELPLVATAQPEAGVTYAAKIEKAEAPLDWRLPAAQLGRQVRAFNPFPGALAVCAGQSIKIWMAEPVEGTGSPGEIIAVDRHGIVVACATGALRLTELQKAGGKRLPVAQFLAGTPVEKGAAFELPA